MTGHPDASTTAASAADWETLPAGCPICADPHGRLLWTRHGFRWLRCQRDGMVWVSPQLTEASVDEIYRRVDARKAATLGGRGGGPSAPSPGPSPKTAGGGSASTLATVPSWTASPLDSADRAACWSRVPSTAIS